MKKEIDTWIFVGRAVLCIGSIVGMTVCVLTSHYGEAIWQGVTAFFICPAWDYKA